jgi:hypothetical protein
MTKWPTFHAHFIKSLDARDGFLGLKVHFLGIFIDLQTLSLLFCLIFHESFVYLFKFSGSGCVACTSCN